MPISSRRPAILAPELLSVVYGWQSSVSILMLALILIGFDSLRDKLGVIAANS